jgi:diaminopimelate decarboxylase
LLAGVDKTLALSDAFEDLEFVDLGGGFPIEEARFDFERYRHAVSERMEAYSQKRGRRIRLILEPGRAIFGNTAFFCAQVTDVKERPDRYLVCLNASATLIPRAMFYEDYNPADVLRGSATGEFDKPVDLVGATTYSRDFIGRKVPLARVHPGDWLKLHLAGSYCYAMITRFLGQAMPPEYLIRSNGEVELIRQGESYFSEADEIEGKAMDCAATGAARA